MSTGSPLTPGDESEIPEAIPAPEAPKTWGQRIADGRNAVRSGVGSLLGSAGNALRTTGSELADAGRQVGEFLTKERGPEWLSAKKGVDAAVDVAKKLKAGAVSSVSKAPGAAATVAGASKEASEKFVGKNLLLYRRSREHAPKADAALRGTAGSAVGAGTAYGVLSSQLAQNALLAGGLGASTAVSLLPGAAYGVLPARTIYAHIKHEKNVNEDFERVVKEGEADPVLAERRINEAKAKLTRYSDDSDVELLAHDGEIEEKLLLALHNSEVARPATTPYLGSLERYAKFCYVRLKELCERSSGAIPGLMKDEVEVLNKFSKTSLATLAEDERHKMEDHLYQMSVVYGRMLCNYHREKREGQVTGSLIASGAAASYLTLNPIPLLVGGGLWVGRKLYRRSKIADQHVEIGPSGRLQGKGGGEIISVEAARSSGGSLFRPDILGQYKEESQLSDNEKRWLPLIQLPQSALTTKRKSPEALAHACAPYVQTMLGKKMPFPKSVDAEEKEDAKKRLEKEEARLESLETELKGLKRDLGALEVELVEAQEQAGGVGGGERGETLRMQAGAKVKSLEARIRRAELRITELETADTGEIARQQVREKEARDEYKKLKNPEKSKDPMGPKAVGENIEIARAFSVKVHAAFKLQQDHKSPFVGVLHAVGADDLPKAAAKETAKFVAAGGLGTALGAGLTAAAPYIPVVGGLVPGFQFTMIGGAVIGGSYYIWKRLTK